MDDDSKVASEFAHELSFDIIKDLMSNIQNKLNSIKGFSDDNKNLISSHLFFMVSAVTLKYAAYFIKQYAAEIKAQKLCLEFLEICKLDMMATINAEDFET